MADNQRIRVGIVGAGDNTRSRHIPGLQNIDGVDVISVANRSRDSSDRVAQQFGLPVVYESWQELVRAPDTDAIVIGTWPYLHCPVTLAALAAGKHVMCEARMAMNADEARQMQHAAAAHPELTAQIVPSPFTLGVDRTIRRLVEDGTLGDLLVIEVQARSGMFLDRDAPMTWRQDTEFSGLNIMALGIWYEAMMRWIGEADSVEAAGRVFTPTRRDAATGQEKRVGVPEHLVVNATMACGAQATFLLSSITGGSAASEVALYGSEASLRFRDGVLCLCRKGETTFTPVACPPGEAGAWRVEEEFVAAIRGTEPITHTTFETGVRYMVFTEAVTRSLSKQRAVKLAEV